MFFKHILNTKEQSLLHKFFTFQKASPVKHDWVNQIRLDMETVHLNLTDDEIREMSKNKYKSLIKKKISKASLNYLNSLAEKH